MNTTTEDRPTEARTRRELLVGAAMELNDVLGLTPEIDVARGMSDIEKDLRDIVPSLRSDDRFSAATTALLEKLGWKRRAKAETKEASPLEEPKAPVPDAPASTSKLPPSEKEGRVEDDAETALGAAEPTLAEEAEPSQRRRAGKARAGTYTAIVDDLLIAGGTWEEIAAKLIAPAQRLKVTPMNVARLRAHAQWRKKHGWWTIKEEGGKVQAFPKEPVTTPER